MQLGTSTAHIVIDGVPLKEYDVVFESATKATCWIASEEGKSFGVQWKCHEKSRTAGAKCDVTLDGISSARQWMYPGTSGEGDTMTLSRYVGTTTTWDFMFTRLKLCDDDSLLEKVIPKDFGQICLTIRRGQIQKNPLNFMVEYSSTKEDSKILGDNKFHERSKKATVHCVGLGPGKKRTGTPHSYRRFLIPNSEPEISFIFKYQSLGILQANGIAPRPTTVNGEPSELNDRIRSLENELKRLRDQVQPDDTEDRKPKRVKREQLDPRPRAGEVIDLT